MPQLKQHQRAAARDARAAARDARAAAAAAAAASEVPIEGKGKGKVATATEVLNEGKGKGKIATAPEVLNKGKGKGKIAAATEVLNEGKGKGKVAATPEVLTEGKGKGKSTVAAAPEVLTEGKGKGKSTVAAAPEVLTEGKGKGKSTVAAAPEVLNESKGKGKGKVAAAFEVPSAPEVWSEVLRLQRELGTAIARVEQLSLHSSATASSSTSGSIDSVVHPPPEPVVVRERQRLPEYASFRPLSAWPDYQDEVKCDFGDCNNSRPCTRAPVGWIKLTNKYKGICAERLHKKVEEEEQALLWANTPSPPKVCRWADECDSLKHNIVVDPDDLIKTKTGAWQCYKCRYSS